MSLWRRGILFLVLAAGLPPAESVWSLAREPIEIRGHPQAVYLYGPRSGDPVIVSSGDGGWVHLAPHVAELLAARGYFVVGFDVRTYLSSFTAGAATLAASDAPRDYHVLTQFAREATGRWPILIGVSEGAGLSVLAATDPAIKKEIAGVIGLGLPDVNELGWRWKDMIIYLTHRAPDEPAFSVAALACHVAPVPLAAIHSTHDEFVPVAEVETIMKQARDPKRLWLVSASNHRFSDNEEEFDARLIDAMAWVREHGPR